MGIEILGGDSMMAKFITAILPILILFVFWIILGNSHKIKGRQLKIRSGLGKNIIEIDDITSIYDTDIRGPARLNDGKAIDRAHIVHHII